MPMNSMTLGDAMYDAVMAVDVNQDTEANGEAGRERFRAIAGAIIDHIAANATIAALLTDGGTPAGTPPHTHIPSTIEGTGKIS
jgi:hypothetical protein